MVLGALIRVYIAADPDVFRILAVAVLAPVGLFILRKPAPGSIHRRLSPRTTCSLAFTIGIVGGIYGIGGGSILGPVLVGRGLPVSQVAPAALASTFAASLLGASAYALLSPGHSGSIAPDWFLGLACGLGGLIGGYLGARLQPRMPETFLRLLLGTLAAGLGTLYAINALR